MSPRAPVGPEVPTSLFDRVDLTALHNREEGLGDRLAVVLAFLLGAGAIAHDPADPGWPDRDSLHVAEDLMSADVAAVLARSGTGEVHPTPDVALAAVVGARQGAQAGGVARTWCLVPAAGLEPSTVVALLVEAAADPPEGLGFIVLGDATNMLLRAVGWSVAEAPLGDPLAVLGAADHILDPFHRDGHGPRAIALTVGER